MPVLQRFSIRLNLVLLFIVAVLLITQIRTWQELQKYKAGTPTALPQTIFSEAETSSCTATVNVRHLNQRSGPGENYPITGAARNRQVMNGIGWDNNREWLLVSTSSGSAWMYAQYMTLTGNCEDLPIRETPETAAISESQIQPANRRGQRESELAQPSVTPEPTPQAAASTPIAQTTTTALSPIFTAEVQYWAEQIMGWSATYQIDPNLIATVIQIESCGDPTVSSSAGAQGLFQVMPFHFAAGEDMLDIATNARRGLAYLQGALELSNGDVGLALAGYNGGYGVMNGNWALETRRYSYWGSGIYAEAVSGATVSPTLQEWLAAGGSSLCARASASQNTLP